MHIPLVTAYFTYPDRKKIFSLPSNNSAIEKLPQPRTLALSQGTFAQNHPFWLPPLYKSVLLCSALETCLWFTIVCSSSAISKETQFSWLNCLPFCFRGWRPSTSGDHSVNFCPSCRKNIASDNLPSHWPQFMDGHSLTLIAFSQLGNPWLCWHLAHASVCCPQGNDNFCCGKRLSSV